MRKIIWSCWFQGIDLAPEIVRSCLQSWRNCNPKWDCRFLDASTIARYLDVTPYIDLNHQRITAASLSDILRLLLLHEYGGVWVDATTYCNTPLDEWLDQAAQSGFFAFARPGEDRELASWFLAAHPGNRLLAKWTARAIAYWRNRESTRDYFWVHHQFGELLAIDDEAFSDWQATPHISADGPHSVQSAGLYSDFNDTRDKVDWSAPVFKLTHRIEQDQQGRDTLLKRVVGQVGDALTSQPKSTPRHRAIAHIRVSTENLGDHIQVIAAEQLLARVGFTPKSWVDRDDEIADPPLNSEDEQIGILLNGWFKTNPAQWPPHRAYAPIYLGFHIRLFQSPSLIGPEAIAHYQANGPIGCRDRYTLSVLRSRGVEAFLSHCLTLTYPRRLPDPGQQTEIFVVSRDRKLLDYLPRGIGPYSFISHYSDDRDFANNMIAARALLETYRSRARLIITSLLHCALPAIAMGIPVVVIYPPNMGAARTSDRERFSSLSDIIRVFEVTETSLIDWRGYTPDVGDVKLRLIDAFIAMAAKWGPVATPCIEGIAPTSECPLPDGSEDYSYFSDPDRLERLARARAADRQKWGAASSYRPQWAARGQLAAIHIADGDRVLEIGAGVGTFRALVADRCDYVGADLQPISPDTLTLNLETDPLPAGPWNAVVMLGVLEYIHHTEDVMAKVLGATSKVVFTYCCPRKGDVLTARRGRGWVNALMEEEIIASAARSGFTLAQLSPVDSAGDFEQKLFVFKREGRCT